MKRFTIICFIVCCAAKELSAQGPFGLPWRASEEVLRSVVPTLKKGGRANVFQSSSVPKPHPNFRDYIFLLTKAQGLCKVVAIGNGIERDAYGVETRSQFSTLREQLEAKYGPADVTDQLRTGSIWDEPKDWMMALYQKERTLSASWMRQGRDSVAPGIETIELKVNGSNGPSAYITLTYEGTAINECIDESKKTDKDAL